MGEANPIRLTLPQQIVANCLGWFCVELSPDGANGEMIVGVMREHLPAAHGGQGHIKRVVDAAAEVVRVWPDRRSKADPYAWNRAMIEADIAMAAFLFWRAALAREALKPSPPVPEPQADGAQP